MKNKLVPLGYDDYEYGCVELEEADGKLYMSVDMWSAGDWEEIPEYLFRALERYRGERITAEQEKRLEDRKELASLRLFRWGW